MSTMDNEAMLARLQELATKRGLKPLLAADQADVFVPPLEVKAMHGFECKRLSIEVLVDSWLLSAQKSLMTGTDEQIEQFFDMVDRHADAVRDAAYTALFFLPAMKGDTETTVFLKVKAG